MVLDDFIDDATMPAENAPAASGTAPAAEGEKKPESGAAGDTEQKKDLKNSWSYEPEFYEEYGIKR